MLTLTGCSSLLRVPDILKVQTAPVEKHQLKVPKVDQYDARNLEWIVLTPENVDEVFAKLKDSKTDLVLFAVTDKTNAQEYYKYNHFAHVNYTIDQPRLGKLL